MMFEAFGFISFTGMKKRISATFESVHFGGWFSPV